jgi:2-polyprenyl-3-methyl-5-hydroxy-6-metoxy-1,4-benzoquinol methylase
MRPGPYIRRLFGKHEHRVGEIYRSMFIDIDAFVDMMRHWNPNATRILEVGCGEGAVTERIAERYPHALITAIDISSRVGRLFLGSHERVKFLNCSVEDIVSSEREKYDLIVLSDVVHHVPPPLRQGLLNSIRAAMAPQGSFVFKDWERNFSPIHWMSYAADRWLTGDRISYMSRSEMRDFLTRTFGAASIVSEARVRPRWNNLAMLVRP